MNITKKKIAVIIVLALLTGAAVILFLYARNTYGEVLEVDLDMIKTREDYNVKIVKQEAEVTYLTKEGKDDFKILAFTDMHFDGMDEKAMDKTMEEFLKAIDQECPDLVVFTGDIVTAIFNKERAETIADTMETYGIYWCTVLGNHEGEHPLSFSRENLIKLWADDEKYPHCLVEEGPAEISGYGNYVVHLMTSEGSISQSLIFMDSGNYVTEEDVKNLKVSKGSYAYIKSDQIEWYKKQIASLPEGNKSSMFIHIPLCEYAQGWERIYNEDDKTINGTEDCNYISGLQREPVCCAEYNSGFFEVIKVLGSTKDVYCGHDHINDYSIVYQGIGLHYLQASGYATYGWNDVSGTKTDILEEQSLQGYTILEMKSTGENAITRIRYKQ
jgi:3',5'-cyclic AMP phosphodiesterase CpdA